MSRVALYSPYIPKHAGGGERYLLSIAEALLAKHDVSLLVSQDLVPAVQEAIPRYERIFGLHLGGLTVSPSQFGTTRSPLTTLQETRRYDALFAMTDGSIPVVGCKQSYLIMQVPWTRRLSLAEKAKLQLWSRVLVYSQFVAAVLQKSWNPPRMQVVSPYVDLEDFSPAQKEPIILNIGRFFAHQGSNSKRQDVLIDAFIQMIDRYHLKGWHLYLVGNIDPNEDSYEYVSQLRKQATGYPICVLPNVSYAELRSYAARASLYWHAAGYGVDIVAHPENTEHFGITTLEAMASGCVPFVVPFGGQAEVLPDQAFWWDEPGTLAQKSSTYIKQSPAMQEQTAVQMRELASRFGKASFTDTIRGLV